VSTNPDNISMINKDVTVLANKYVEVQKDDKNSCVLFVHTL